MNADRRSQRDVTGQLAPKASVEANRIGVDVKARIQTALQRQAGLDTDAMSIAVDGNTVTLSGVVDSWSERTAAHNAAWSAPGVQEVIDNLSVAD